MREFIDIQQTSLLSGSEYNYPWIAFYLVSQRVCFTTYYTTNKRTFDIGKKEMKNNKREYDRKPVNSTMLLLM